MGTDLGVGDTTVVAGFRVGLVLAVTIASSGTTTHLVLILKQKQKALVSYILKTKTQSIVIQSSSLASNAPASPTAPKLLPRSQTERKTDLHMF